MLLFMEERQDEEIMQGQNYYSMQFRQGVSFLPIGLSRRFLCTFAFFSRSMVPTTLQIL